ncbi:MAG: hypothetical protein J6D27_03830 [Ruminiclostridium sp.]|nr:hypothetical protein [Ruminiclostridium sp.]
MTVEELNVIVRANANQFNQQMAGVQKRLGQFGKDAESSSGTALSAFKSLASGIAALGIGKILKDSIMSAGELEQNLGGSEAVFKKYAATMQNTAKTAASAMGLSQAEYLATANKMGALFQGSGFGIGKSAEMTMSAMQRAADVASIMGVDISSAMEAVTGAAKGNFTMMDNLGVAINDTTLQIYAQEKGLGKLETTQQKVNAAMQMFLDKTEYADGNYAKENETLIGSLTTLKAELSNLAAEAGTAMLPLATSVIPIISGAVETAKPIINYLASGIGALGDVVEDVTAKFEAATPAQKTLLKIALGMAVAIPAVTVATKLMTAAKAGYATVLNFLIPKQLTFGSALKASLGWIGLIAGAISILGILSNKSAVTTEDNTEALKKEDEELITTKENSDKAAEGIDNLTDAVKKSTAGFDELNKLGGNNSLAAGIVSEDDLSNIEDYSEEVSDLIDKASKDMKLSFDFDMDSLVDGGKKAIQETIAIGGDILGAIFGNPDEQYKSLKNLTGRIEQLFGPEFTAYWQGVGEDISKAFSGDEKERYEAMKRLDGRVRDIFGDEWSDFWYNVGLKWNEGWTTAGDGFNDLINGDVSGGLKKLNSLFETFFGDTGKAWSDYWFNIGKGWMTTFQGIGASIYEATLGGDQIDEIEVRNRTQDAIQRTRLGANEYMRQGYSASEALEKAKADHLKTSEQLWAWEKWGNYNENEAYENIKNSGQISFTPSQYYSWENQKKLRGYASGGFPDYGSLFVANEGGPELVGTLGGRTAVVNNAQIETALYNAVFSAFSDAGRTSSGGDIHITLEADGEVLAEVVARQNEINSKRFNGR